MTTQQLQSATDNRKRYKDLTEHLQFWPPAEKLNAEYIPMIVQYQNSGGYTNQFHLKKEFISIDEFMLVYRARINAEIERLENEFNSI